MRAAPSVPHLSVAILVVLVRALGSTAELTAAHRAANPVGKTGWRQPVGSPQGQGLGRTGAARGPAGGTNLTIGLLLPYTNFGAREYTRAVNNAVGLLNRTRNKRLELLKRYHFAPGNVHTALMTLTPSPKGECFTFYDASRLFLPIKDISRSKLKDLSVLDV